MSPEKTVYVHESKHVRVLVGKLIDKYLEVSKVNQVHIDKHFIHLDKLKDGTWRVTYSLGKEKE